MRFQIALKVNESFPVLTNENLFAYRTLQLFASAADSWKHLSFKSLMNFVIINIKKSIILIKCTKQAFQIFFWSEIARDY